MANENSNRHYHVVRGAWDGDDLECWDTRYARGDVDDDDWKWPDATLGYDGHLVCLSTSLEDSEDFLRCELGSDGEILAVDIEGLDLVVNDEGCIAAKYAIEAWRVTRA